MRPVYGELLMIETVQRYLSAYERRSMEDCLECFVQSPALMAFGTAKGERLLGIDDVRAQILKDWEQTTSARLSMHWWCQSSSDDFGWLAADLEFEIETSVEKVVQPARATFVLVKSAENRWLIEHAHFSVV